MISSGWKALFRKYATVFDLKETGSLWLLGSPAQVMGFWWDEVSERALR